MQPSKGNILTSLHEVVSQLKTGLDVRLAHFSDEIAKIRSGRVTTALIEDVKVEAYDSLMPLKQLATLTTPDPKSITIDPWDKSLVAPIEKALMKSGVGATPTNDGNVVHLNFPPLSEERRKELTKTVKKMAEECKVAMRQVRREQMDELHKLDKTLSKDEIARGEDTIQKTLLAYEQKTTDITERKASELMTV